jgi:hypothetical protein
MSSRYFFLIFGENLSYSFKAEPETTYIEDAIELVWNKRKHDKKFTDIHPDMLELYKVIRTG